MHKTTEPVIIMTPTELEAVIDAAAKRAVGDVMKRLDQLAHSQLVEKERGEWASVWVRAERYCELSGEPINTVMERIREGIWAAGKHYKRTGPRTLWVNLKEVDKWIGLHVDVEAAISSFARRSKQPPTDPDQHTR